MQRQDPTKLGKSQSLETNYISKNKKRRLIDNWYPKLVQEIYS